MMRNLSTTGTHNIPIYILTVEYFLLSSRAKFHRNYHKRGNTGLIRRVPSQSRVTDDFTVLCECLVRHR